MATRKKKLFQDSEKVNIVLAESIYKNKTNFYVSN